MSHTEGTAAGTARKEALRRASWAPGRDSKSGHRLVSWGEGEARELRSPEAWD